MPASPAESSTNPERALQAAWFRAEGLARVPDDRIHPADDMYREDTQAVEPERRRITYMRSGWEALRVLDNACRAADKSLSETGALLDFAGGYGRLLRFLVGEIPPDRIWFSDILSPAVSFAADTFGVHSCLSRPRAGDLQLPRRFDVIWVGSLFSHLPRPDFDEFLSVLFEVLEPEGLLVFSTHTPRALPEAQRDPSGFTFMPESESRILDVQAYGAAFVEPQLVRQISAGLGIEHVWTVEQDLWRIQDVHVVARQHIEGLDAWTHTPLARGSIERIEVGRDLIRIGGWARVPIHCAPIESVHLIVDETRSVATSLIRQADDLPPEAGGSAFHQTDWYVEGPVQELGPGLHTLCAVGNAGHDLCNCFDARSLHVD